MSTTYNNVVDLHVRAHSRSPINAATVLTGTTKGAALHGIRAVKRGANRIDFTTWDTIVQDVADGESNGVFSQGSCVDWWFPVTVVV